MNSVLVFSVTLVASYLVGAVPFGFMIARARGVNILRQGSGNIGATNVGRVLGRRFGILAFLLDFAKGALPTAGALAWADAAGLDAQRQSLGVAAGLSAFVGHLFPVYLRFRGGKGVATGAGVVTVLLPGPASAAFLAWLVVMAASLYMSLASVAAVLVLCVARVSLTPAPFSVENRILTCFCFVAAGLVLLRHRSNIGRLFHGSENRLEDTPAMRQLAKILHVWAVGLWFGSVVFFTFSTSLIFDSYKSLAARPPAQRPAWLPTTFSQDQANELAGWAVGPIFPWFFLTQGICGVIALVTALSWSSATQEPIHRRRFLIVGLALLTVVIAWPIAQKVSELRMLRYDADPGVAEQARNGFLAWHMASLALDFVTMGLVTAAMAFAARLPTDRARQDAAGS